MNETFNTEAIILKRDLFRESDSRVFVYTPDRGKIEVVARGTQKPGSKLVAHIEPFNSVDLMVVLGKNRKYIGSVISNNCYSLIKNDFNKVSWAGTAFNIFNSLVREDSPDPDLFYLLKEFLSAISEASGKEELYAHYFYLKLLAALGYRPELDTCLVCGKKIAPEKNYFVFLRGGLFCADCSSRVRPGDTSVLVSNNCLKLMKQVLNSNFAALGRLLVSDIVAAEFKKISSEILKYQRD